jgi:hypothetical protein
MPPTRQNLVNYIDARLMPRSFSSTCDLKLLDLLISPPLDLPISWPHPTRVSSGRRSSAAFVLPVRPEDVSEEVDNVRTARWAVAGEMNDIVEVRSGGKWV